MCSRVLLRIWEGVCVSLGGCEWEWFGGKRTWDSSSSGWVFLKPPFPALVTGVRRAETKTTSLADFLRMLERPRLSSAILAVDWWDIGY